MDILANILYHMKIITLFWLTYMTSEFNGVVFKLKFVKLTIWFYFWFRTLCQTINLIILF